MMEKIISRVLPGVKHFAGSGGFVCMGEIGAARCKVEVPEKMSALLEEGLVLLAKKITAMTAVKPLIEVHVIVSGGSVFSSCGNQEDTAVIRIDPGYGMLQENHPVQKEEGYFIDISANEVIVSGYDDKGTFYSIQTLMQLLTVEGNRLLLPCGRIEDWPDMKYRGLFAENRYGSERITYEEWTEMIDIMASLKMNSLMVGIYGCWCIQYDNRISEFLLAPLKCYPQLQTPHDVRYYSVKDGEWKTGTLLPEMDTADYFGKLVEYAKKRNITVKPLFNSMGHNTLLPRMFPEISVKDENGADTGYGLCTSSPKTYEVLFNIYDEIIKKYLAPNGIDWFSIGMDEVRYESRVSVKESLRKFSPWCRCEECRKNSDKELVLEHVIRLAKHLKSRGINNIKMYHDQLRKMGLVNEDLISRLKKEGLDGNIILDWWSYESEPFTDVSRIPVSFIRGFIMPMSGYFQWIIPYGKLTNISRMMQEAAEKGLEGVEAYGSIDYSSLREYSCIAEFAWNQKHSCDLEGFRSDFVKKYFYDDYEKAKAAFECLDRLSESGMDTEPLTASGRPGFNRRLHLMLSVISYYFYSYQSYSEKNSGAVVNFPGDAFKQLYEDPEINRGLLAEIYEFSLRGLEILSGLEDSRKYEQKLPDFLKLTFLQYKVLAKEFLTLIELSDRYNAGNAPVCIAAVEACRDGVAELRKEREKLMLAVENTKAKCNLPMLLRNMSIHRQYLIDLESHLNRIIDGLKGGMEPELPLFNLFDTRELDSPMARLLR